MSSEDENTEIASLFINGMLNAHGRGNDALAKRLERLAFAALEGGGEAVLKDYVEGPEYNAPRAKRAREYIQKAVAAHNKAAEKLTAIFTENAGEHHRPLRKIRREFMAICDEMQRMCNLEYIYKAPNGSTTRGPKVVVEGDISMDPILNQHANVLSDFWAQSFPNIENGARVLAGIAQDAGPRLTANIDPALN